MSKVLPGEEANAVEVLFFLHHIWLKMIIVFSSHNRYELFCKYAQNYRVVQIVICL